MKNNIKTILDKHINTIQYLSEEIDTIEKIANIIIDALKHGNKVLIAGNGGSAADAQHFAGELVCKFQKERKALPAIALNTNTSVLTAIGNDYSFEEIFSRQIEALSKSGDVFLGISTSGNSLNIIKALKIAKRLGCQTIGFTGKTGGKMQEDCDILFKVNSQDTPRIQEVHILVIHILCELIEENLFNE